VRGNKIIVKI